MKIETKGRGRPATGKTTIMVRIPTALKLTVAELVKAYREETKGKVKRLESSPVAAPSSPSIDIRENQKQLFKTTT